MVEKDISLKTYGTLLNTYLASRMGKVLLLTVLLFVSIVFKLVYPLILRYFIDAATEDGALRNLMIAAFIFIVSTVIGQLITVFA